MLFDSVVNAWYDYQLCCSDHVAPLEKPGKRYRNVHADVFVIADEDDENGEYMYLHVVIILLH